ncbi:hypothetical protein [Massilia suwonensis]|uniref:Uncharacterized protein n=1 Tax=Massilia suwonensis TaxID=648895 RepID=A0ABW0MR37_9BURK
MKLILTLLLASLLLPSEAARRIGEAQVRMDANGQPCFTISEREEKRSGTPDFQAITVSEGQRVLWRMVMPRDRTFPVSFSMCIPYGGRVTALPQTPAVALGEGKAYSVQLEVRPGKSAAMPLRYQTQFCLDSRRNRVSAPVSCRAP